MEDASWLPNCDSCKKLLARAVKNYPWACDTCDRDFARDTEASNANTATLIDAPRAVEYPDFSFFKVRK